MLQCKGILNGRIDIISAEKSQITCRLICKSIGNFLMYS
jgi:hypothetical protein